jgi:hypothetical protein
MKNKMAPKFYGPHQVINKISQVTHGLDFLDKSHIHNVFHVSHLKKMLGKHQTTQTTFPTLDGE